MCVCIYVREFAAIGDFRSKALFEQRDAFIAERDCVVEQRILFAAASFDETFHLDSQLCGLDADATLRQRWQEHVRKQRLFPKIDVVSIAFKRRNCQCVSTPTPAPS